MKKIFLIGSISLLCIACSVGPNYHRPPIYKNNKIADSLYLKSNSKRKINPLWYQSFGDDNLNKLIEQGLEHSPNIKVAIEKMQQARYKLYIDRSGFLPSFDAKGQYNKSNQTLAGALPINSDYYQVGLDASWELDIWGGRRRLDESARAMLKATAADFDNVKISLISEIANQYINWILAEKQLSLMENNLKLQTDIFETVEAKYKAGLADSLDYEQAKSLLDSTKMKIPQLRLEEKSYQNALSILVGKLPVDIIKNKSDILYKKFSFELASLYDLPVDIVRNRPDVQATEQQLIAENALIGQAIANLFPSVSLSAFLGYQNNTLSPIFGPDFNMYTNGAVIHLPILHWGELINQVKLQESATKQAFALYQASLLNAVADISNAINSVKEETKRNISAKAMMDSTKEISTLSLQKYQNGLIEFSDVLTAEQNKISAEQEYLQSNAKIYQNIVSFYKSVGGGLAIDRNKSVCQMACSTEDGMPCKD